MGGKQLGVSDYEKSNAQKRTKREKFLAEMEKVFSWQALVDLIAPYPQRPGAMVAIRHIDWPQCSGFTGCSSGTASVIQLRRMR